MQIKSIRPFIGSKNFEISRQFYRDIGFEEVNLETNLSLFKSNLFGFYLQDAYVKDWIDNTMVFVEVSDADAQCEALKTLNLSARYENAKLIPTRQQHWGKECFLHDPSGILWHFGEFYIH